MAEGLTGRKMEYVYVDQNRSGDHICYLSDLIEVPPALCRLGLDCGPEK